MKTSFKSIMENDFELFNTEEISTMAGVDFAALQSLPAGRQPDWTDKIKHVWNTVTGFDMLDLLVITSPAAAVAAIIFVGIPVLTANLQVFLRGMQSAGW